MFALGNVLLGVTQVLGVLLNIYMWVVVIAALVSWVNPDPNNPIVVFLRKATDPIFRWFRNHLPFLRAGGFDLAPLAVILAIVFLQVALVGTLHDLANRLK